MYLPAMTYSSARQVRYDCLPPPHDRRSAINVDLSKLKTWLELSLWNREGGQAMGLPPGKWLSSRQSYTWVSFFAWYCSLCILRTVHRSELTRETHRPLSQHQHYVIACLVLAPVLRWVASLSSLIESLVPSCHIACPIPNRYGRLDA